MSTRTATPEIICYGQTRGWGWAQETYETASGHARVRAQVLRRLGYRVAVEGMGEQVTPVGRVKMTLLSINFIDQEDGYLPPVRVERL